MKVFLKFCFFGVFIYFATAQNVTDLINKMESGNGHLRHFGKTRPTEDQSEAKTVNSESIESVNNDDIDVIRVNFKNASRNKEVKVPSETPFEAESKELKESDEFQITGDLSTIFAPDTSEGFEDATKGVPGHLRHEKVSESVPNPSNKLQSPSSDGTSAATRESTAKSSPTPKPPDNNDVVLVSKASPTTSANLLQRSLAWMSDTYTLSIIVPVAAGFIFASVIIVTVAVSNCIKRRCRRRKLRRKVLPDTVRRMRPADRARLLAESSDEEF